MAQTVEHTFGALPSYLAARVRDDLHTTAMGTWQYQDCPALLFNFRLPAVTVFLLVAALASSFSTWLHHFTTPVPRLPPISWSRTSRHQWLILGLPRLVVFQPGDERRMVTAHETSGDC